MICVLRQTPSLTTPWTPRRWHTAPPRTAAYRCWNSIFREALPSGAAAAGTGSQWRNQEFSVGAPAKPTSLTSHL
jgi:hypothetical protein